MKLININDGFDQQKLINFCKHALNDPSMPAAANMDIIDWQNKSNTLLHSIFIQKRFTTENRAGYILLEVDGEYVAGGGINQFATDPNICATSTRSYTIPSHRSKHYHGDLIVPMQIELAKTFGYKSLIWTFDEYNLKARDYFIKFSNGSLKTIGRKPAESLCNWVTLDYPIYIYYTRQWALYKHLDESYHDNFIKSMADIRCD